MQKLHLLQEMPIIKSAARNHSIYARMTHLLSQTDFKDLKDKKNFIVNVRTQVKDLAELMRELSGSFDYRSTLVQFLAAIFVLISLMVKVLLGDPKNGIFRKFLGVLTR